MNSFTKIAKKIDQRITNLLATTPVEIPARGKKVQTILEYKKLYDPATLVETGTYLGETVDDLKTEFQKIVSIELDEGLYRQAKERFADYPNILILQGDSGELLVSVLDQLDQPALFWLDGHYSGGITAKGNANTPITRELQQILSHKIKNHIILIDDARCFNGEDDYPTIQELFSIIQNLNNNLRAHIENDIIVIYPSRQGITPSIESILRSYREPWKLKLMRKYKKLKRTLKTKRL